MPDKTIEPENAVLVEQIIDDWMSDKEKILSLLAEDCTYVVGTGRAGVVPFYGTFRGREGVQQFFRLHDAAQVTVRCMKPPPARYALANDKVVVSGVSTYRILKTGKTYESYWVLIWRMSAGRIAGLHFLFDDEVLEAQYRTTS